MLTIEEIKKGLGTQAAQLVEDNMTIGIGTGSTAHWLIVALGERIQQGLQCRAVPTSRQTALLATAHNIPLIELNDAGTIRLTIDGADEIDPHLQLIKGGGGALLQEKMVAAVSERLVIMADHNKLVTQLGAFPLPIEVIPYNWKQVKRIVEKQHAIPVQLRTKNEQPFITDHGHYILDCHFQQIVNAPALDQYLHSIPGIVETGLFLDMAHSALIGYPDGSVQVRQSPAQSLASGE